MATGEAAQFVIGAEVACSDGDCGALTRVVVDPVARAVTHLVVEPRHHPEQGRLVPISLAEPGDGGLRLRCTRAEFDQFEAAEESQFQSGTDPQLGYGPGQVYAWPYYGLGMGGIGMGGLGLWGMPGMPPVSTSPRSFTVDRVPLGEVDVRRGESVHAKDGVIGHVQGLVIDPGDHHVTHVLLAEGHLWGQKDVAIPIGAVTGVEDGIHLSLTKDEVRDLPAVAIDR